MILKFVSAICGGTEKLAYERYTGDVKSIKEIESFADTFKTSADVGKNLEIKWTGYDSGHLIVYPTDRDSDVAVLVTNRHPRYVIKGWMPVTVAKKERYKKHDQDSWWVSQINLQPIDSLERSSFAYTIGSMSAV